MPVKKENFWVWAWILMAISIILALLFFFLAALVFQDQECQCSEDRKGSTQCVVSDTMWDTANSTVTTLTSFGYAMFVIAFIFMVVGAHKTMQRNQPERDAARIQDALNIRNAHALERAEGDF